MKCILVLGFITALFVTEAGAQQVVPPETTSNCAFNNTPPTVTTGQMVRIQCDSQGRLLLSPSGGGTIVIGNISNASSGVATSSTNVPNVSYNYWWNGTTWDQAPGTVANGGYVQGAMASGVADSGNPIKIGGVFNTTAPNVTNGTRVDWQFGTSGAPVLGTSAVGGDGLTNTVARLNANTAAGSISSVPLGMFPYAFNGSTWDRQFACPNTAIVNVTAAATTEIVPLTAAQTIRVCSFVLTESLAGTATFVYGTGTNCATGTTSLTGAMAMVTGGNISISSGNGSVLRTASANALCLTAATGNVTGFVTYAKY